MKPNVLRFILLACLHFFPEGITLKVIMEHILEVINYGICCIVLVLHIYKALLELVPLYLSSLPITTMPYASVIFII